MPQADTPVDSTAGAPARLFELSVLTLFLEVLLIRWVPAEIRIVGYFINFVLIACFFGMGLGCLTASRRGRPWWSLPLLALALLVYHGISMVNVSTEMENILILDYAGDRPVIPLWLCLFSVYVVTAAVFVPLGQEIGRLFAGLPPLRAYTINIAGSLVGTLLMPALSFLNTSPGIWTGVAALLLLHVSVRSWKGLALALIPVAVSVGIVATTSAGSLWSPYQKVSMAPIYLNPREGPVYPWVPHTPDTILLPARYGFNVLVNDDFIQSPLDLSPAAVAKFPSLERYREQYEIPAQFGPLDEVLVVGAGTGNDVAALLRRGARHIDAVEIDPLLIEIGKRGHPEHPYDDPRVRVVCDDARSFFKKTHKKYDLVVFGLLDSHRLTSRMSNIRLDSYVYTVESMREVRRLLEPDGIVVLVHALTWRWPVKRIFYMLREGFDERPHLYSHFKRNPLGTVFVAGPGLQKLGLRNVDFPEGLAGDPLPSDDWPFFYLRQREVPREYLVLLGAVFALSALILAASRGLGQVEPSFFLLGAAFMLLETRSITASALFFGSTWMVATVVICGLLLMILLANLTALRLRLPSLPILMALLAAVLAANALVPAELLQVEPPWVRVLLVGAWLTLPLYTAGLVFARQFAITPNVTAALGWNLLGGVAGGFLEYASMVLGYNALLWVALGIYLLAFALWQVPGRRAAPA